VRPLLAVVTLGIVAGELAGDAGPGLAPFAALAIGAGGVWLASGRRAVAGWAALALLAVGLGRAWTAVALGPASTPDDVARLPLPLRTTVTGRVVAAPERREHRTILIVDVAAVGRGPGTRPARGLVRVGVRGRRRFAYGDRLRFDGVLRAPRNFENPGRFDYVGHLARRGIHVTASVWRETDVVRIPVRGRALRARLERWRARLARRIPAAVPGDAGAVLEALVMGDEGDVEPGLRDAFGRAGVVHVLSISGLHVALVAAAAFALVRALLARSVRLVERVDVERLAAAASLVPVGCYTALAGFQVATLRSAVMVVAAVVARLVARRVDVLRTLAVAALVLAIAAPGSPLEISFQLSFASVLAIVLGTRAVDGWLPAVGWRRRVAEAAIVSPCALAGTAPLTAFHFHQLSVAGLVANPLVVPLFGSAVVVPGLAGALLEPFAPAAATRAFQAAGVVLRPAIALVRALGAPAWAAVDVPIPTLAELAIAYAALGALVWWRRPAARWVLVVALAAAAIDGGWWLRQRHGGVWRVTFLDVGQGDAAVAELPDGGVLVVDAGGFPGSDDFDTGAAIVAPFLYARKILRVDAVAMTHAHPDHSGGIPALLAHFRPRELWWTGVPGDGIAWEQLRRAVHANGVRPRLLDTGTGAPLPGVRVLHPPPGLTGASLNDSSLTLRIAPGGVGFLLTGDVEARAEGRLLGHPEALASTVLKVPHHGSRTSSTPPFVAAVAPAVAVISVGADNRYRLPSREVEARWAAAGACVLRTDRCGAVTVTGDGDRIAVASTRGCACPGTVRPPG